MNRAQIALSLLKDCPPEALVDHWTLARMVRDHAPRWEILGCKEADRWPETYVYLKNNLEK